MSYPPKRWERCIMHRDGDTPRFLAEWFSKPDRRVLLIGGAGFDPRSTAVAKLLTSSSKVPIDALLIREQRPLSPTALLEGAEKNIAALKEILPALVLREVNIFSPSDMALTGGRKSLK